jgi:MFS family permease
VPANEIAEDLQFRDLPREMGWVQSAWYLGYGLLQIPSGSLADRFGGRRTLVALCLLWSFLTLLTALASGLVSLLVLWGLMGAAQAGAFPCATKAIGQIFPESQRARATGLLASGMLVGGAIAPVLTAYMLGELAPLADALPRHVDRWRLLLAAYAIPGFLWAIAFLAIVSRRQLPAAVAIGEARPRMEWSRIWTSWPLALLCAQQFFRAAGMVFFMTWFPTFLQKTRGVSLSESGMLTTVAVAGGVVGSLSGGFFSDWLLLRTGSARLSRQGIAVLGMAACSALILASYFADDDVVSIALIAAGAFCASFGGVSGYTVAIGFGGRHVATVFSVMNMCGNFGAALFPVTAGWLVATTGNWNLILFLFAGIMAVDAVCWALLNPRGTLFGDEM